MPPRVKITKQDIINAAVSLVRRGGAGEINSRGIAASLGCSTQPIFSNFSSMEELEREVIANAYNLYTDFIKKEVEIGRHPQYKAFGMAYIRFAKEEKELFKLLFMRDRTDEEPSHSPDFEESVEMLMLTNKISREAATLMHLEMWTVVHGIGAMMATSFFSLEWELISNILTDVYQGIRTRHISEETAK